MDAAQLNKQLDSELLATGVVSREVYFRFSDAHGYGAATSVAWLEAKLRVLASRVASGKPLMLYSPAARQTLPCHSPLDFSTWAAELFPSAEIAGE